MRRNGDLVLYRGGTQPGSSGGKKVAVKRTRTDGTPGAWLFLRGRDLSMYGPPEAGWEWCYCTNHAALLGTLYNDDTATPPTLRLR